MNVSLFLRHFFSGSNKFHAWLVLFSGIVGFAFLYVSFQRAYKGFGLFQCFVFYGSAFFVLAGFISLIISALRVTRDPAIKIWLFSFALFLALFIAELALRVAGKNDTYPEMLNGRYVSPSIKHDPNIYRNYKPYSTGEIYASEFRYSRHHNNFGYSDFDFKVKTDSTQIIVQTYGDSFTEGDGAPADSCYPAVLQSLFNQQKQKNTVIQNFGICGNDPAFYIPEMRDMGRNWKPDIAVMSYGSGDFCTDFFNRGGLERFKGTYWQCEPGPSWEWVYASTYLFRLCLHSLTGIKFQYFLTDEKTRAARFCELEPKWNETFLKIAELAQQNNIQILLLKKPEHQELDLNHYEYDFTFFEKMVDTMPVFKRFDLLPYYRDTLGIGKQNSVYYFWIKDGHHNPTGYAAMAKGVYAGLKKNYPKVFVNR